MFDIRQALAAGKPVECTMRARVVDAPRTYYGTRTHAEHEDFHIEAGGIRLEVVQNLKLAPSIPAEPGDEILLHGEFVPHGSHGPLMHWIHHSPGGGHEDGYAVLDGKTYA